MKTKSKNKKRENREKREKRHACVYIIVIYKKGTATVDVSIRPFGACR